MDRSLHTQRNMSSTRNKMFTFSNDKIIWKRILSSKYLVEKMKYGTSDAIPGPMELLVGFTRLYCIPMIYFNEIMIKKFLIGVFKDVYDLDIIKYYDDYVDKGLPINIKYLIIQKHLYYSELFDYNDPKDKLFKETKIIKINSLLFSGILDLALTIYLAKLPIKEWKIFSKEYIDKFYTNIDKYGNKYTTIHHSFIEYYKPRISGTKSLLDNLNYFMNLKKFNKIENFIKSNDFHNMVYFISFMNETLDSEYLYDFNLRRSILKFTESYINNIYIMTPSNHSKQIYKSWKKNYRYVKNESSKDMKYVTAFIEFTSLIMYKYVEIVHYSI